MDYGRIYREFIADRRAKPVPQGYTEKHHIVPRSLGGGDDAENIITLTAEDHIFAHLLLAKAYGGKLWFPLTIMLKPARQLKILSRGKRARRIAALAKKKQSERQLGQKRPDVSLALRGKPKSDTARAAMSAAAKGKVITAETRAKMSKANKGRKFTAERNAKIAKSKMGENNPAKRPEVRQKIAAKARFNSAGHRNPRYDKTIYSFRHEDGRTAAMTKYDMAQAFGLNRTCLNYVIKGERQSTRGWTLAA